MPINEVTLFEVECDICGVKAENDDECTCVYNTREDAAKEAREYDWQVSTAGTFCPDHAEDEAPLEQPGPTLLDI
jgi:hypothetical protein